MKYPIYNEIPNANVAADKVWSVEPGRAYVATCGDEAGGGGVASFQFWDGGTDGGVDPTFKTFEACDGSGSWGLMFIGPPTGVVKLDVTGTVNFAMRPVIGYAQKLGKL